MTRLVLAAGLLELALALACGACSSTSTEEGHGAALGPMPPDACDVGTRPSAVDSACTPVAIASCADGFARASDGWGCEAVVPAEGCSGVDRARLGDTACAPDADCAAAFPPAGVDTVVHSDAELASALESVPSGGTIALADGVYGAISIERDVNLVGRCAERVRVRGDGLRGIYVAGRVKASIRSLAVEGFQGGIVAAYGPELDVAEVVLSSNQLGVVAGEATVRVERSVIEGPDVSGKDGPPVAGAADAQLGAKLTLNEVEIRNTSPAISAYEDGTEVVVRRSFAHDFGSSQKSTMVHAWGGAQVTLEDSAVWMRGGALAAVGDGLPATEVESRETSGAVLRVAGGELRQSGFVRDEPWATVTHGGRIELDGASVLHESVFAFMAGDAETSWSAKGSAIRSGPTDGTVRSALFVTDGATAEMTDTAIVGAIQNAVTVGHPGSSLRFSRSLVTGTEYRGPGPNAEEGGVGIALAAGREGALVVEDSAIVSSQEFGLMVDGLSRAELDHVVVDGTLALDDARGGDAVVVSGAAQLSMTGSIVRGSGDAAVMSVGGEGIVDGSRFSKNRVGVHVTATRLVEVSQRPPEIQAEALILVNDVFADTTESRIREAPIVLPGGPSVR